MVDFKKNRSSLIYFGLLLTLSTVIWYAFKDIRIGWIYTLLFLAPTVLLLVGFWLIDEENKNGLLKNLKYPFSTNPQIAAIMFLFGSIGLLLIQLLIWSVNTTQFSVSDYVVPLAAEKINILIQQTSQQLTVASSMSSQLFNTLFTASFIEEFIFSFVMVYIIYIAVALFSKDMGVKPSHGVIIAISIIVTGVMFAIIHSFNSTYTSMNMYIIAGVIRILMTAAIYYTGLMFSFLLGLHQMNNLIWFIKANGLDATIEALKSWTGIILLVEYVIIIAIFFSRVKPIDKLLADIRREVINSKGVYQ